MSHTQGQHFRFFLWNDMHIRAPHLLAEHPSYPFANEKALWALECAQGRHGLERPDFVLAAGDIINGEIPDFSQDFDYLKDAFLSRLGVPFMPCLGNHENRQGEGIVARNQAYDRCFGPQWHNYVFTSGGIGFIVVDSSGGHRLADEVTAARNAFVERAFARLAGLPIFVVTHIPLIAMREEAVLKPSFGFSTWRNLDTRFLELVEAHADSVIAVLCGHIHLTSVRLQQGIYHIMPAGTAGYPSDFASFDVYDDRVIVRMHRAPEQWLHPNGNIHGRPRHAQDYTDAQHSTHESYVWGNPDEREFTVPLEGIKRPQEAAASQMSVLKEV